MKQLQVRLLTDTAQMPMKAHETDAGFDIFADETVTIKSGETKLVSTGIGLAIPEGYYGRLKGRSGLTSRSSLRVQEGTIDSDYRGEVFVICEANALGDMTIEQGDKFAQLIIQPLPPIKAVEVKELDSTERGEGGFGSTGI